MENAPLVSIGLPVYNGERYLEKAFDSLLAIDYPNIELIICDNASTDRTVEIIHQYTELFPKSSFQQNEKNLGPTPNFQKVVALATGKYFFWAAHDDLWDLDFVTQSLKTLTAFPNAILATPTTQFIQQDGTTTQHSADRPAPGTSPTDNLKVFYKDHACSWIYGLFKTDWLKNYVHELDQYVCHGGDILWLVDILTRFSVVGNPNAMITKRLFPKKQQEEQTVILQSSKQSEWLHVLQELTRITKRSPQSLAARTRQLLLAWKYVARKSTPHGNPVEKIKHLLAMAQATRSKQKKAA